MKAPAFQLYPQDFISSLDVQVMNVEQIGAYVLLLFNAWIHEPQGYLPNNDLLLQRICRMNDKQWSKNKSLILKKFEKDGEFIFNNRLLKELEKQGEYRKKQALNGSKGGRPKANINPEKAVGLSGLTQTKPKKSSSFSSSISTSVKENISSFSVQFDEARSIYPGSKKGNPTEFENFCKKHKDWKEVLPILKDKITAYKEWREAKLQIEKWAPDYKNFSTWINGRHWEDEHPAISYHPNETQHTPPKASGLTKRQVDSLFGDLAPEPNEIAA